MSIDFGTPVASFGGFFNYSTPLTLSAYDAGHVLLGSVSSVFFSNLALSGDVGSTQNELLQLAFAGGISSVLMTGDVLGGSFTLDDATLTPIEREAPAVPEPGTLTLFLLGGAGLIRRFRSTRSRRTLASR
jgi:hypothetical protein